ncbi:hydrolase [Gordonia phage Mossy]|nr:hydrolase [Gordonia phage Mossy]
MTFLQAPEVPGKRIFENFNLMPSGALPSSWIVKIIQNQGPEVINSYVRNSQTTSFNSNSRSMIAPDDVLETDDQIIMGTTRTVMNGLLSGIFLRSDPTLNDCVLAIMSTTDNQRGIYLMVGGVTTRKATYSPRYVTGETWALKAEGSLYSLIQNPNSDGTGGEVLTTWNDVNGESYSGSDFRHGGFFLNSDRNAFGQRNYSAALDDYDFRDLTWIP